MSTRARHAADWDVVGVGANSLDYVYTLPTTPQPGGPASKLRITSHARSCGGQTTTTLAACSRLGLRARYIGATGTDDNGDRMRDELSRRGIDLSYAVIRDAPNPYAVILVDALTGERIVLWDRDERLRLDTAEISVDAIAAARILHVDDVDPGAALVAAHIARTHGLAVTSDFERADASTAELVAAVTHPIFSDHGLLEFTGMTDVELGLRKIRQRHAGLLTVTLGAAGCVALEGDRLLRIDGVPVPAVDTTGAGDVFRAGFIYGLLQDWSTNRILRFANGAAAASCTRAGAMGGVPDLAAVVAVLGDS